jgi:hypothetical protein
MLQLGGGPFPEKIATRPKQDGRERVSVMYCSRIQVSVLSAAVCFKLIRLLQP